MHASIFGHVYICPRSKPENVRFRGRNNNSKTALFRIVSSIQRYWGGSLKSVVVSQGKEYVNPAQKMFWNAIPRGLGPLWSEHHLLQIGKLSPIRRTPLPVRSIGTVSACV